MICDDARGAARQATALGKKFGWRPLFDTLEVDGVPLSASARNPGHASTQKSLRAFSCVFEDTNGQLTQDSIFAFDAGNAKTVARAKAKSDGTTPLFQFLKALAADKAEIPKGQNRLRAAGGMVHPGVQVYSFTIPRQPAFDPENDEIILLPRL